MLRAVHHIFFLRRRAGVVDLIEVFKQHKIVLVAVHEQRGGLALFELFHSGGFFKGKAVENAVGDVRGGHNDFRRHMIGADALVGEDVIHAGKSAVLDGADHILRQILAGGHHRGCRAHGDAVQHDFHLRVFLDKAARPVGDVQPVQPAHGNIFAFAVAVSVQIGDEHIEAAAVVFHRVARHFALAVRPAVDDDRPVVAVGGVAELHRVQGLALGAGDGDLLLVGVVIPFIAVDEVDVVFVALKQAAFVRHGFILAALGAETDEKEHKADGEPDQKQRREDDEDGGERHLSGVRECKIDHGWFCPFRSVICFIIQQSRRLCKLFANFWHCAEKKGRSFDKMTVYFSALKC